MGHHFLSLWNSYQAQSIDESLLLAFFGTSPDLEDKSLRRCRRQLLTLSVRFSRPGGVGASGEAESQPMAQKRENLRKQRKTTHLC